MGRSRGGLTTKIHALVDAEGLPIMLKLTAGQAHDGKSAADMLEGLAHGQTLLADAAYDSNALRQSLAERGAFANIKPLKHRKCLSKNDLSERSQSASPCFVRNMEDADGLASFHPD